MASSVPGVERLYLDHIELMERLCRFVCRSTRMSPPEIEDFTSHVKLRLLEDDYAVLRKFEGRCTLASYLTVVIRRQFTDYRIHHWGRKWHSSAEATRLGPLAARLEIMLHRDRKTLAEAFQVLRNSGETVSLSVLQQLADRFPVRTPRATYVSLEDAGEIVAQSPPVEENAAFSERLSACHSITSTIRDELSSMPPEDVTILRLHFYAGMSVADIARSLQIEQKPLYKHLTRLCQRLRARLIGAGIDQQMATDLIGRNDAVFDFGLESEGNASARPSSISGGRRREEPSAT